MAGQGDRRVGANGIHWGPVAKSGIQWAEMGNGGLKWQNVYLSGTQGKTMGKRVQITALVGLIASAAWGDLGFLPAREALLEPAPNKAWDQFSTAADAYGVYPVAEGVYLFMYRGTNALFMVTDAGVIATDPIRDHVAPLYLSAIRSVTDQPVKYLVYSHWHWDHVEGGQHFRDAGAKIISHEACVPHFTDNPNPKVAMPDATFSGSHTLKLGNRALELIYLGRDHSDCLVYMRPDGLDALFVVDLVTPGSAGGAIVLDYVPHHWVGSLKAIEAMNLDYIISGHGVPIAHPSAVSERRRYLETLMGAVKVAYDKGLRGAEQRRYIGKEVEPYAYMRNFSSSLPGQIARLQIYYATGW